MTTQPPTDWFILDLLTTAPALVVDPLTPTVLAGETLQVTYGPLPAWVRVWAEVAFADGSSVTAPGIFGIILIPTTAMSAGTAIIEVHAQDDLLNTTMIQHLVTVIATKRQPAVEDVAVPVLDLDLEVQEAFSLALLARYPIDLALEVST